MSRRKKSEEPPGRSESLSEHPAINEFAELIVESMKEDFHNELEPFEVYAQKLRSQVHSNVDEFRQRFARGYQVILEELGHHQTSTNHKSL